LSPVAVTGKSLDVWEYEADCNWFLLSPVAVTGKILQSRFHLQ
jgi:hypothetical protein